MHKKLVLFLLIVFLLIIFWWYTSSNPRNTKEAEVMLMMETDSPMPIIYINKIDHNKFLLLSTKAFVKQEENFSIYLQGKINLVEIDTQNNFIQEEWNYTPKGFKVFSYPLVKQNSLIVAVEDSPNLFNNETEVFMLSFNDFKFKKIASVDYFVLSINSGDFNRDGREDILLTGYDPKLDLGKVTLLENSSLGFHKVFERSIGNRTFDAYVVDINEDGYPDFIVSADVPRHGFSPIFINEYPNFKENGGIFLDSAVDIKSVKLGSKIYPVTYDDKSIYLLDLKNLKRFEIYRAEINRYIFQVEVEDLDHDGFDELVISTFNDSKTDTAHMVELKYLGGSFVPVSENRVDLRIFSIKWIEDNMFLIGSDRGLYLINFT